ncbi:MAG TPA: histidine kinase N-terminal 7TM domain-containing protein [Methylomirabilota bacterium]|nr:histidine kinase N-terminal 7TM domain-containing protein [Methylomirabilota bacterium]
MIPVAVPGGWQASPLSAVLLLATALSAAIVVIVGRRRLMPGTVPFTLLMAAAGEWAAMAALEHAAVDPATKVLFAKLEYPGIVSVAPLWLTFALAYTARGAWLTPGRVALLWIVPVATVALTWTNDWHRLVWTSITASGATPGAPLVYGHGPAFWAAAAYNYALNVAGTALLVVAATRVPRQYRRQSAALLAGLALPWLGNALYLGGWHVVRGLDLTPLAFALTGLVYVFGVFRVGLFDVVPVARHLVIESMADGVLVLDVHNRVVDINPSARAMLGVGDAAVIGVAAGRILAQWPDIVARYRDVSQAQEELRLEGADGLRYLDLRISPLRDRGGRLKGRLIVVSDVTARRRAEEALRQNEKLASLGQLLAGVAHELNNPLSVIVGHTTLLLRTPPGSAGAAARVEKIATAAERCGRIVKSFLAIARQRVTEHSTTDVNRVLREAADFLAYQLAVDEVAITFDLRDLPPIWADPHQLHQVVLNLLTNARHALRAVGGPRRIVISSRHDPARERVRFAIADNGPGIPPALRQRIFEPFFTTKPAGMGSGLGLSVCRGIVAAHEGSIAVEGADGGGAAFVVELPIATRASVTAREEPRDRTDVIRGKRILVVDDEATVAEVLAEILAVDDHEVTIAADGAIALELLEAQRFDLIITDMRMPVLDGPALYQRLRRQDPGIRDRFVFLTGDTLSADTTAFLQSTGAPTLTKPFEGDVVRRVVQDALRNAATTPPA